MQAARHFAERLFAAIRLLRVPHTLEPSFKLTRGHVEYDRYLCGLRKARLGAGADQQIVALCTALGMPSALLHAYSDMLPQSPYVLFGYERQGERSVYKAYLEFDDAPAEPAPRAQDIHPLSRCAFLGYKWFADDGRQAVISHYDWVPELTVDAIRTRTREHLAGSAWIGAVVDAILHKAGRHCAGRPLQYMEVSEPGNPRRSLDVKLYAAGMTVGDIADDLRALADGMGIGASSFASLPPAIARSPLGHLACGINREGEEFATIYHGVRRLKPQ